jgi:quercetin 2,3-dioxygenase
MVLQNKMQERMYIHRLKSAFMKKRVIPAHTRGHANHGWLDSWHSFSFAQYYDPERIHFGLLRVLNDDNIGAGAGFGLHPHDNMEIISIILDGQLEHRDTKGNKGIIKPGDVQVMSAGSGLQHSEYNASKTEEVNLLQIWIFPDKRNVEPRYDQKSFDAEGSRNKLQTVVSPDDENGSLWIHQQAWLSLGDFSSDMALTYKLRRKENGLFLFVLEGEAVVEGEMLGRRDAMEISETDEVSIHPKEGGRLLLIDVPMN